jgi:hypothetical protein
VKLLLDEHISGRVARRLRDLGHDVVAVAELPTMHGRRDAAVFEWAQGEGRAVVTYDRGDFEEVIRRYTQTGRLHHGLVVVHPIRIPSNSFSRLAAALAAFLDGPDLGLSFVIWLKAADTG